MRRVGRERIALVLACFAVVIGIVSLAQGFPPLLSDSALVVVICLVTAIGMRLSTLFFKWLNRGVAGLPPDAYIFSGPRVPSGELFGRGTFDLNPGTLFLRNVVPSVSIFATPSSLFFLQSSASRFQFSSYEIPLSELVSVMSAGSVLILKLRTGESLRLVNYEGPELSGSLPNRL